MSGADTRAVLVAARALIDERGWWQAQSRHTYHGYCVVTALSWVSIARNGCSYSPACDAFVAANDIVPGFDAIASWNDSPGRTKGEVLAAFDRAIAAQTGGAA